MFVVRFGPTTPRGPDAAGRLDGEHAARCGPAAATLTRAGCLSRMIPGFALPLLLAALPYGPDPGFLPPEPGEVEAAPADTWMAPDARGFLR